MNKQDSEISLPLPPSVVGSDGMPVISSCRTTKMPPVREESWWRLILPGAIPSVVAGAGFWIFHRLAVRRQRRSEINDKINEIRKQTRECVEHADQVWCMDGNNKETKEAVRALIHRFHYLGILVTALKNWCAEINVTREVFRFRKACTTDVDDPGRGPNPHQIALIIPASMKLNEALDSKFRHLFR